MLVLNKIIMIILLHRKRGSVDEVSSKVRPFKSVENCLTVLFCGVNVVYYVVQGDLLILYSNSLEKVPEDSEH